MVSWRLENNATTVIKLVVTTVWFRVGMTAARFWDCLQFVFRRLSSTTVAMEFSNLTKAKFVMMATQQTETAVMVSAKSSLDGSASTTDSV